MKKVKLADVTIPLLQFVQELGREPVILMYKGKPLAVIQPVWDADVETVSLSLSPKFQAILQESRDSIIRTGGIPFEEVCRDFGVDVPAPDPNNNGARRRGAKKKIHSTPTPGDGHGR